ncbi:hypothetical protein AVEN_213069-1 [Araneus ventricosus]|uniref:Uncharacterized protein n=1 Tax=Araneus ventricosus TaxID=182803 RepID=A0A4Y2KQ96_ARAVE|nr:hypothetical protein AVEN_213069-1 [Araneus ventricosus]
MVRGYGIIFTVLHHILLLKCHKSSNILTVWLPLKLASEASITPVPLGRYATDIGFKEMSLIVNGRNCMKESKEMWIGYVLLTEMSAYESKVEEETNGDVVTCGFVCPIQEDSSNS